MIEALYGIEFESNQENYGYGVVVCETGRVLGGDSSFVYVGSYTINDDDVIVKVKCTNDRKTLHSIFGDIDEFNLHLEGKLNEEEFTLQGYMIGNPSMRIVAKLTRRAELP